MKTDLELQQWLAAQLPEEILELSGIDNFRWSDDCRPVTEYEWLHVVSLVEAKIGDGDMAAYTTALLKHSGGHMSVHFTTWQQRTRALMEALP